MVAGFSPCHTCSSIFTHRAETDEAAPYDVGSWRSYYRLRGSLDESARNGCKLCQILRDFDRNSEEAKITRLRRSGDLTAALDDTGVASFALQLNEEKGLLSISIPKNLFANRLEFRAYCESGSQLDGHLPEIVIRDDRDKEALFDKIRNVCRQYHDGVHNPIPTRLLNVSRQRDMVFLEEGDSAGSDVAGSPYAALSYNWGSSITVVTTKENYSEHASGISVSSLPQTLQDAIKVTRELGLTYLWIDALCIVQDHNKDKEHEMAVMQRVYQNSYITIVAACGANSDSGFFKVPAEDPSFVAIPVLHRDGRRSKMFLCERSKRQSEPVNERAWTLQECLLSPRLLIYSRNCIFFRSPEHGEQIAGRPGIKYDWNGYCASSGMTTVRLMRSGQIILPPLSTQTPNARAILNSHGAEKLSPAYRMWKLIVADYASRHLTNPRDKLPALSGIVTYFKNAMDDDYLAGLWRRQLAYDLSWTTARNGSARRPRAWRAPSWSWMSIDGPVAWEADRWDWFDTGGRTIGCHVEPALAEAPFSQVKGGTLSVAGMLTPFDGMRAFMKLDDAADGPEAAGAADGTHWCLELARCFNRARTDEAYMRQSWTVWGLLLWKLADGKFLRAGHFRAPEAGFEGVVGSSRQSVEIV